ncbi:MAG: imidazolonepropionase [Cyclobacteriaceae bacterium]|nr:imidazolonepropionase [Cyclobacteriaceae bacterium]
MLITNIKGLAQVRESTPGVIKGGAMADLPIIEQAFLAIKDGKIADYGQMKNLPSSSATRTINAEDRFVLPSFVDSHTHLVFAASREEEFVMKINGASYAEIAAKGGGILNSANKLQQMSEDELFERTRKRADEIIRWGTGAVEIKSGYGLTVKDELKMLRVARKIGKETPLKVKTTFLGAHAIPKSHTKEDYVKLVLEEMIPAVAEEKLADYIDVFCEEGFFSKEETIRIAEEGKKFGMRPRIHANQLKRSGGVQAGVEVGAISVDHLENIGEEEIEALRGSDTIPTALPGAAYFLNLSFPPARDLMSAGLPLAIASDYNPGSSPTGNMQMMVSMACIKMKMTPEEAFNAATINTAAAMEVLDTHGSITRGKTASVLITKQVPSIAYLPYAFGTQWIEQVIINGQVL